MASSRFVTTTLNGMFITQLAAWMTTPVVAAAMATDQPPLASSPYLSRADDDPAMSLDNEIGIVIPKQEQAGTTPPTAAHSQLQAG